MFNFINTYSLLGALGLFLLIMFSICAYLMNRSRESFGSLDYFGPDYQRDLQRYSDFNESDDSQSGYQPHAAPFLLGDRDLQSQIESDTDRNSL